MIKIELECTPEQLRGIADVMEGKVTLGVVEIVHELSDVTNTNHIEAKIPVSQGGTVIDAAEYAGRALTDEENANRERFNEWWVTYPRAAGVDSPEYHKELLEWSNAGCPDLDTGEILPGDTVNVSGITGPGKKFNGSHIMDSVDHQINNRQIFDEHWETKVALGCADEMNSAEYDRCYLEWTQAGCPTLEPVSREIISGAADDPASTANENKDRFAQTTDIPVPAPAGVELDANGLPWDARIHGKTKKQNANGTWKYIKKIDREVLVPQVEAELRQTLAAAPKPAASVGPTDMQQVGNPIPNATIQTATGMPVPGATGLVPKPLANVPAPIQAPVPTPASVAPTTFHQLLPRVTAAKNAGTLTDAQITAACEQMGIPAFGLIATRPDLVPQAALLLGV